MPAPVPNPLSPAAPTAVSKTVEPGLTTATPVVRLPALNLTITADDVPVAGAQIRVTTPCGTVYRRTTDADGLIDDPGFPYAEAQDVCVSDGSRKLETTLASTNFNGSNLTLDITSSEPDGNLLVTRARLRDEDGFTLVELLAAMVVGMIVLFAVFGLLDGAVRIHARTTDQIETSGRGRLAIDLMSQSLGSRICLGEVPSLVAASDTSVEYYASLAPERAGVRLEAQRRRLTFSGGAIREEMWTSSPPVSPPDVTAGGGHDADAQQAAGQRRRADRHDARSFGTTPTRATRSGRRSCSRRRCRRATCGAP